MSLHLCEICASKEDAELFLHVLEFQDRLHKLLQMHQSIQHRNHKQYIRKGKPANVVHGHHNKQKFITIIVLYLLMFYSTNLYCRLRQIINLIDRCTTKLMIVLIECQ